MSFFEPLRREQIIREESTDIPLNFFILRFFLHLTESLVREMAMQLAKKLRFALLAMIRNLSRKHMWPSNPMG